jgi:hypothetical protein
MSKLKTAINLQTAFGEYRLDEQLGEGGAGRVYASPHRLRSRSDKQHHVESRPASKILND